MSLSEEYLPYLESFLEETWEQLQALEKMLISLEKNPHDHECLDSVFRIVHTLKGNAATVGLEEMARLAHHMEDLLDNLRKGKIPLSDQITDILLTSLDALNGLADEASGKGEYDSELSDIVAEIVARLEALASTEFGSGDSVEQKEGRQTSKLEALASTKSGSGDSAQQEEGRQTYRVVVTLDKACIMRAARACVIVNRLKEVGELAEVWPSLDEIQSLRFKGIQIEALLISGKSQDFVAEILQSVPEVSTVEVFREGGGDREKEEAAKRRIKVGVRIDVQLMTERMREAHHGGVIIDLSDLSELSPAGLNWLLKIRETAGVELVLPKHPQHRRFFELLGFG